MTIISAVFSRHCIAIGSDSLIVRRETARCYPPAEDKPWKRPKIVRIEPLKAAVSYWGLACFKEFNTIEWLHSQARSAHKYDSLESFAKALHSNLTDELSILVRKYQTDCRIGIHLTGYENVDGVPIPELFLMQNFSCSTADELCFQRHSYAAMTKTPSREEHGDSQYRREVHKFLSEGGMLVYNNGDNEMFGRAARAIFDLFQVASNRHLVKEHHDIEIYRSMAIRPIEVVAKLQHDFCREDTRLVGGRTHDLAITPSGEFSSTSASMNCVDCRLLPRGEWVLLPASTNVHRCAQRLYC